MMQGRVNHRCEATLAIVVKNNEITPMVDAVCDLRIQAIEGGLVTIEALK